MSKDLNKTIDKIAQEYKDSVLTYETLIKIFPKVPPAATIKKLIALIQLYGITLISSQEQASRLNAHEIKKKEELRTKNLANGEDDEYDLLKNKEFLEWSRSDSPVRMYLREMGQIPLLSKEEEVEISKQIEIGEDAILDAICSVPYLIDFILEYREPLMNRERKVKELFKTFDDEDENAEEEEEEDLDSDDEYDGDEDAEPTEKKEKKLDKRAEAILESFKVLEKSKKEWMKFMGKEADEGSDEIELMQKFIPT